MLLQQMMVEGMATRKRRKVDEHERHVLTSEICLFCNLYDLFTRYSISEVGPASHNEIDRVLQPQ